MSPLASFPSMNHVLVLNHAGRAVKKPVCSARLCRNRTSTSSSRMERDCGDYAAQPRQHSDISRSTLSESRYIPPEVPRWSRIDFMKVLCNG